MPAKREDRLVGWPISRYGTCSHYCSTKRPCDGSESRRGPRFQGTFSLACFGFLVLEAGLGSSPFFFFDDFSYEHVSKAESECIVRVVEGVHGYLTQHEKRLDEGSKISVCWFATPR